MNAVNARVSDRLDALAHALEVTEPGGREATALRDAALLVRQLTPSVCDLSNGDLADLPGLRPAAVAAIRAACADGVGLRA